MLLTTDTFRWKVSGLQSNVKTCQSPDHHLYKQNGRYGGMGSRADRDRQPEHHRVLDWGQDDLEPEGCQVTL